MIMKSAPAKLYYVLTAVLLLFISCQTEEFAVVENTTDNLIAGSDLANLLARVAQYPTSADNAADNNSCFSINLPFKVIINDVTVLIDNPTDYNVFSVGQEHEFVFPLTVTYADYTETVIANRREWNSAVVQCIGSRASNDLACLELEYPVSVNTYDVTNQIADVVLLNDNEQLYSFLNNSQPDVLAAIAYPLSITSAGAMPVLLQNNEDFESFLNTHASDCVPPAPIAPPGEVLSTGTWRISLFTQEGVVQTQGYAGYSFSFNSDGTVLVTGGSQVIDGTWDTFISSDGWMVALPSFGFTDLDALEEADWKVTGYTATAIKLTHTGTGINTKVLHFERE
jgi:hypothetical protein